MACNIFMLQQTAV